MRNTFFLIVLGVLLTFVVGVNSYLGFTYAFYFGLSGPWLVFGFFVALNVFMIAGIARFVNSTTKTGQIIFVIASTLMGGYLYLSLITPLVDLIDNFIDIQPVYSGLLSLGLTFLVSAYGIWNARIIRTKELNLKIGNLNRKVRAAHLTDTHIGHFRTRKSLEKIVNMINAQQVDVTFFTGDLLDGKIRLKPEEIAPLKNLKAPVFFVEGNHDEYTGAQTIKSYLRNEGINVLENEVTEWNDIQVIGLNHMIADKETASSHANTKGSTIKDVLRSLSIDKSKPSILLHHSPDGIKYVNEHGVDLYLTGHTHGGQMWPVTLLAGLMFEYNKGLHSYNETKIYVSQGTGTFGPPMRIGTYSELAILNLS